MGLTPTADNYKMEYHDVLVEMLVDVDSPELKGLNVNAWFQSE